VKVKEKTKLEALQLKKMLRAKRRVSRFQMKSGQWKKEKENNPNKKMELY
jgi:hypothetical protein